MGKINIALDKLNAAINFIKDDPVIYNHLGDVYRDKENWNKARKMWNKALEFDSKNQGIMQKLESIPKGSAN